MKSITKVTIDPSKDLVDEIFLALDHLDLVCNSKLSVDVTKFLEFLELFVNTTTLSNRTSIVIEMLRIFSRDDMKLFFDVVLRRLYLGVCPKTCKSTPLAIKVKRKTGNKLQATFNVIVVAGARSNSKKSIK